MISTLAPLDDRVVITPDTPEQVSAGGILIPQMAQKQETIGTVVAVGPGLFHDLYDFGGISADSVIRYRPMIVKPGDRVLYSKYAGAEVEIQGEKYQVMKQEQIIAILGGEVDPLRIDAPRYTEIPVLDHDIPLVNA